jgi:hypothetical protein
VLKELGDRTERTAAEHAGPSAAAFLAAAESRAVGQRHVLHAAQREHPKLGKMIDKTAFGGAA